ncbi:nuclear transport factor 2 family protein [Amycolatopsis rhizosphaerae]|uniref:Nuclear transport factor 2 family protein n=1 Tax=Amycolatopsis rhizosphaerae TaxID=2053003 RepID=A0A558DJZ4_9PSEU|nr:nuclear transport factor 2 family protein [Amycolatopsis rhizosphaerae]TVT61335.1 nuclear transport factor 2 family protein [Amycolatopsis rhizosphaerae]
MTDDMRIAALEGRLRKLEDEAAIAALIASYGPLVDAGDADGTAALWAEDGSYDVEGWRMSSREDVRAMVLSGSHQEIITGGSCHFLGPAHVTVDGDEAIAVCDSILVRRRDDGFVIERAGVSHFQLRRLPEGWRIAHRKTRLLDGSVEARTLLVEGVRGRPV